MRRVEQQLGTVQSVMYLLTQVKGGEGRAGSSRSQAGQIMKKLIRGMVL